MILSSNQDPITWEICLDALFTTLKINFIYFLLIYKNLLKKNKDKLINLRL